MNEHTYTLDEAERVLRERECSLHGHDWEILTAGLGEPSALVCGRCGESRTVSK